MHMVVAPAPGMSAHDAGGAGALVRSSPPLPAASLQLPPSAEAGSLSLPVACAAYLAELADRHYALTTLAVRTVHLRLFGA